jgi:hypothetical protein
LAKKFVDGCHHEKFSLGPWNQNFRSHLVTVIEKLLMPDQVLKDAASSALPRPRQALLPHRRRHPIIQLKKKLGTPLEPKRRHQKLLGLGINRATSAKLWACL